jgi:hypothetical protein
MRPEGKEKRTEGKKIVFAGTKLSILLKTKDWQ